MELLVIGMLLLVLSMRFRERVRRKKHFARIDQMLAEARKRHDEWTVRAGRYLR